MLFRSSLFRRLQEVISEDCFTYRTTVKGKEVVKKESLEILFPTKFGMKMVETDTGRVQLAQCAADYMDIKDHSASTGSVHDLQDILKTLRSFHHLVRMEDSWGDVAFRCTCPAFFRDAQCPHSIIATKLVTPELLCPSVWDAASQARQGPS